MIIDAALNAEFNCKIYDCMGNLVGNNKIFADNNILKINVPHSGLCILMQEGN